MIKKMRQAVFDTMEDYKPHSLQTWIKTRFVDESWNLYFTPLICTIFNQLSTSGLLSRTASDVGTLKGGKWSGLPVSLADGPIVSIVQFNLTCARVYERLEISGYNFVRRSF